MKVESGQLRRWSGNADLSGHWRDKIFLVTSANFDHRTHWDFLMDNKTYNEREDVIEVRSEVISCNKNETVVE